MEKKNAFESVKKKSGKFVWRCGLNEKKGARVDTGNMVVK